MKTPNHTFESINTVSAAQTKPPEGPRYLNLALIAVGGMGEVWRVQDRRLGRTVVRKLLDPRLGPGALAQFREEARITARLSHPGIVPVYDIDQFPDGRLFYTMKEIEGQTFSEVIDAVHRASRQHWSRTPEGWTFHRLISAFHRVCQTVAYAHRSGVVHRDLKPDNLMVGAFGEVFVVDWGLARPVADQPGAGVSGTPAYMPPEQARGETPAPTADVYALGAILYEILTGQAPYQGSTRSVLAAVRTGPPPPLRSVCRRSPPPELAALCDRAMQREAGARYRDASGLVMAVEEWLDDARKRERALAMVAQARKLTPALAALQEQARTLRRQAAASLAGVPAHRPAAEKSPFWQQEDEADEIALSAQLMSLEQTQLLRAALSHTPELPEAHALLADAYHQHHREAEARRDPVAAARYEVLLRTHDRGRYRSYLTGQGTLTLHTAPSGAAVIAERTALRGRRLVVVERQELGQTPLIAHPLQAGSWTLTAREIGCEPATLPVLIQRAECCVAGSADAPVALLPSGALGADDVYVPAGPTISGDPQARNGLPRRRLWISGFVMRRFPVTNREYIAFLDDLLATGRLEEALRLAPRESAGEEPVYHLAGDRFVLKPDSTGDVWALDWPVLLVTWQAAAAWCAWEAARTGQPWRLPYELEWEKAARGADGRRYPWGDQPEASWSCNREAFTDRARPSSVHDFPEDVSPYGVRGVAGNVRQYCLDPWEKLGPPIEAGGVWQRPAQANLDRDLWRPQRGGGWSLGIAMCESGHRFSAPTDYRHPLFGFRACRSI